MDGQGTKWHKNIPENRLSRAHERYKQQTDRRQTDRQTDGRTTTYSEREREFTFAINVTSNLCPLNPFVLWYVHRLRVWVTDYSCSVISLPIFFTTFAQIIYNDYEDLNSKTPSQ